MNELERIATIAKIIGTHSQRVHLGVGDDAAVLERPATAKQLFCSDLLLEGVHFDLRFSAPSDLGHKALTVTLSDIAAMNGTPQSVVISLALPSHVSDEFLKEFYTAAAALARQMNFDIVGGDLSGSRSDIFIDVAAIGSVENPKTRSGAKVGDWLAVSGFPGLSAAGLAALRSGKKDYREAIQAHLRPRARFDLLPALNISAGYCTSLIDISDGLVSEIYHLSECSNVGFVVEAERVPQHPELKQLAIELQLSALNWSYSGGEDYELLAALDAKQVEQYGPPEGFTLIGRAVEQTSGIREVNAQGASRTLLRSGFDHFGATSP